MCADYLFQQDKHYAVEYDTGDRAIQCGRHVDIFKFWLMWRAFVSYKMFQIFIIKKNTCQQQTQGDNGLAAKIDHLFEMRDLLVSMLKEREDFWLLNAEPECTNVCFWYVPPSCSELKRGPKLLEKLGKITPVIKARMMDKGSIMVGYQPLGSKPNFFRAIISNPAITPQDVEFMIEEIVLLSKDL